MNRDVGALVAFALTLLACGGKEVGRRRSRGWNGRALRLRRSPGSTIAMHAAPLSAATVISTSAGWATSRLGRANGDGIGPRLAHLLEFGVGFRWHASPAARRASPRRARLCKLRKRPAHLELHPIARGVGSSGPFAGCHPPTEIDVAWIEDTPSAPTGDLHFTRYRPDFTLLSDTRCFGPTDATPVGVAASGSGWTQATLDGHCDQQRRRSLPGAT